MRAQSSFEAISLFATATIILSVFMIYYGGQISTQAEQREYQSLRDVAETLRAEIQIARQAGPGYARTITIPVSGEDKQIRLTVNYSDEREIPSELTVRFEPPITEYIEASVLLGPGVYGTFSGGTNVINVYEGGIVVEPDPDTIDKLIGDGWTPPTPEAAFAYIEGPDVRLSDPIECEYAASNEFALDSSESLHVEAAFVVNGATCHATSGLLPYGDRVYLDDVYPYYRMDSLYAPNNNLSCLIRITKDSTGNQLCMGGSSQPDRVAVSNNVTIVNSPPQIRILDHTVSSPTTDIGRNVTSWDVSVRLNVSDVDEPAQAFNVSIVRDGDNAAFIGCTSADTLGCLSEDNVFSGDTVTFSFELEVPLPENGGCDDVNRLSFKIRAIESDSTTGLYTLEPEEIPLSCSGETQVDP